MQVQPVKFTGNGQVGAAAFSGTVVSPLTNSAFQPVYTDSATIAVPAMPQRIAGFAYTGFTKVVAYNGTDNTGDVVFVGGAAGTYSFSYEVQCSKGLYVEVTGTGSGTVWLV
jgi:hypothetical protein